MEHGCFNATSNYGVCVLGSTINEYEVDYYGVLEEILELNYYGLKDVIVLFKCHWYDTSDKGMKVHRLGLVEINHKSKLNTNDPFILVAQAQQVYYTRSPTIKQERNDWVTACKVKARGKFDIPFLEKQDENVSPIVEVAYQEEEISTPNNVLTDIDIDDVNIIVNVDKEELNEMEIEELRRVMNGKQVIVDSEELEEELEDFDEDEETQDETDCDSNNSDSELIFVENEVPREITNDIKGVIKGAWSTWKKVPNDIKDLLWENFKLRYNWDNFTDREMKKVWNENSSERYRATIHLAKKAELSSAQEDLGRKPDILDMIGRGPDWMEANIWNDLVKIHWNKEDHKIKCEIARKNKMTVMDGSTTKHTGGSISFGAHRERMEQYKERQNTDDQSTQPSFNIKSWCDVVGDPCKGRVYGFGCNQHFRRSYNESSNEMCSHEKNKELSQEIEGMRAISKRMEEEITESKNKLKLVIKENRQREEQLIEEGRQREENLKEMVRKMIQEAGYTNHLYPGRSGPRERRDK
ncbi:hypothetical protein ZIOFF_039397 [Zingiber officinale]|uniref:DUF4216 domain-containing protein n=1 Tax=Zingiber officinale TaxID=94328 RepID=A0A8J5GFW9_ZINOF|nr:hypothetical protein ZIOFF_039397 [Zingiber officinale]